MNMKFMGILLTEGRKEDLKKKYANKFDNEVLDFVLGISDLQDFNHKYTDFILKALEPNTDIDFWVDIAVGLVKDFDKYQSQLKKKDINQYNTFSELESALEPFIEKEKEKELEKQADKIYEDDKFLVIKPKTEEASCKYGSNTKWCVTQKGAGHFERYTSGDQSLYFIINKANSTNKTYSKVAIHFDDGGYPRYWDSQDVIMNQREVDILNYAFPELIEAINKDYEKTKLSVANRLLTIAFNSIGETSSETKFHGSNYNLSVLIRGFTNIPDLGFGHTEGRLSISLISEKMNDNEYNKLIDEYDVFITYKSKNDDTFTASVGFAGTDEVPNDDFVDVGLEGWGIDLRYLSSFNPQKIAEVIRKKITKDVLYRVINHPNLIKKINGITKAWTPKKGGYKFSKNKGLIKKLIDYLDAGYDNGTKLDFLEYIGKIKSKTDNGKKLYAHSGTDDFLPSVNWRGHFATLFSAAKKAGIIEYSKEGNQFIIKKGPNFDNFKEGKLKTL